jgi:hypothetical protein
MLPSHCLETLHSLQPALKQGARRVCYILHGLCKLAVRHAAPHRRPSWVLHHARWHRGLWCLHVGQEQALVADDGFIMDDHCYSM